MKWIVTIVWMVALLFGTLPLLGWNRYVYEVYHAYNSFEAIIKIGHSFIKYLIRTLACSSRFPRLLLKQWSDQSPDLWKDHSLSIVVVSGWCNQVVLLFTQGYLLSSTVDFLAEDPASLSFIWLLMVVSYIIPNIIIFISHSVVIIAYRYHHHL